MESKKNRVMAKLARFLQLFGLELKKTKQLGQGMIMASKTNTLLNDTYLALGKYTYQSLSEGQLQWITPTVSELCSKIEICKKELLNYEEQLQQIKERYDSTSNNDGVKRS